MMFSFATLFRRLYDGANMTDTTQDVMLGTRVSRDLAKRIERFREHLEKKTPGVKISTSDALRALIERSLAKESTR
jgi:hypothetical protein